MVVDIKVLELKRSSCAATHGAIREVRLADRGPLTHGVIALHVPEIGRSHVTQVGSVVHFHGQIQ